MQVKIIQSKLLTTATVFSALQLAITAILSLNHFMYFFGVMESEVSEGVIPFTPNQLLIVSFVCLGMAIISIITLILISKEKHRKDPKLLILFAVLSALLLNYVVGIVIARYISFKNQGVYRDYSPDLD